MSSSDRSKRGAADLPVSGIVHRGRVLQQPEHGQEEIPVEFLMQFAINLIRQSSKDLVWLSALGAAQKLGIPKEQALHFLKQALKDQEAHGMWPKGFM